MHGDILEIGFDERAKSTFDTHCECYDAIAFPEEDQSRIIDGLFAFFEEWGFDVDKNKKSVTFTEAAIRSYFEDVYGHIQELLGNISDFEAFYKERTGYSSCVINNLCRYIGGHDEGLHMCFADKFGFKLITFSDFLVYLVRNNMYAETYILKAFDISY